MKKQLSLTHQNNSLPTSLLFSVLLRCCLVRTLERSKRRKIARFRLESRMKAVLDTGVPTETTKHKTKIFQYAWAVHDSYTIDWVHYWLCARRASIYARCRKYFNTRYYTSIMWNFNSAATRLVYRGQTGKIWKKSQDVSFTMIIAYTLERSTQCLNALSYSLIISHGVCLSLVPMTCLRLSIL